MYVIRVEKYVYGADSHMKSYQGSRRTLEAIMTCHALSETLHARITGKGGFNG